MTAGSIWGCVRASAGLAASFFAAHRTEKPTYRDRWGHNLVRPDTDLSLGLGAVLSLLTKERYLQAIRTQHSRVQRVPRRAGDRMGSTPPAR